MTIWAPWKNKPDMPLINYVGTPFIKEEYPPSPAAKKILQFLRDHFDDFTENNIAFSSLYQIVYNDFSIVYSDENPSFTYVVASISGATIHEDKKIRLTKEEGALEIIKLIKTITANSLNKRKLKMEKKFFDELEKIK